MQRFQPVHFSRGDEHVFPGTLVAESTDLCTAARRARVTGFCTAIMLPLLTTTILTLIPAHRRGAMMGTVSIVISVAPAIARPSQV